METQPNKLYSENMRPFFTPRSVDDPSESVCYYPSSGYSFKRKLQKLKMLYIG